MSKINEYSRVSIEPGNKNGIPHILDMTGFNTNPEFIDMSRVIPVLEQTYGGDAKIYDRANMRFGYLNVAMAGVAQADAVIIAYGNGLGIGEVVFDFDHALIPINISYEIYCDADERTADLGYDGLLFKTAIRLNDPSDPLVNHPLWTSTHQIKDDMDGYRMYPGDWYKSGVSRGIGCTSAGASGPCPRLPVILPGQTVDIMFLTLGDPAPDPSHVVFPATTNAYVWIYGLQVPVGAPIPTFHK
jgi:hypothetical protein